MSLPLGVVLSACIQQVLPGPDLGPCADLPEGVYGAGDAGIGTCLAGPADLRFFEQDGGTFLAVTNADPFRTFETGSVLVIDWDDVARRLDSDDRPEEILTSELAASAIAISDDDDGDGIGGNPYLGGFGYLAEHQSAIVTSRLTEDGVRRSGRDDVFVLDLSGMELTGGGIEITDQFELEDDPFPVVVDDANQRVYVGNLTDHSVSVLSSDEQPGDEGPLHVIDVATGPGTSRSSLRDVDASGSRAAISRLEVLEAEELIEDQWTLTFVEGSARLWVPTPVDDTVTGLVMHSTGDFTNYLESPFGFELGVGHVEDPFVEFNPASGGTSLWFARPESDGIHQVDSTAAVGEWTDDDVVLSNGVLSSPTVAPLPGQIGLFAGRRDDLEDLTGEVVLATSTSGDAFTYEGPVLSPPDDATSYEDPFVVFDTIAGRYRMWLTVRAPGAPTVVALSESDDGRSWSLPETVLDALSQPGTDAGALAWAAPSVAVLEGRYGMWLSGQSVDGWTHAFSWSYDGRSWSEPVPFLESELPLTGRAPRVAVSAVPVGGWRLEGAEQGALSELVTSGGVTAELFGLAFEVVNGQEVDNAVVSDQRADEGLKPGSAVQIGDRQILFVTTTGSSARDQITALERSGDDWSVAIDPDDLEDMLGILPSEEVSDPLVVADGTGWVMLFTRKSPTESVLLRSTSADGFDWELPESGEILPTQADDAFDAAARFAHSIEVLPDGVRLWYTGDDGSTYRIGSALADSVRGTFEREPQNDVQDYRFGTGVPGGFDDSAVRDPLVLEIGGETHLYYAGLDGVSWHIGHAVLVDGVFERRLDPLSELPVASMNGLLRTFSSAGVESLILGWETPDSTGAGDPLEIFYAGLDTHEDDSALRLGRAVIETTAPDELFATQRFPTAGDLLPFSTTRGGPGAQVIELEQIVRTFVTNGYGMSGMALDSERGFLYVTTKLDDTVFVLDVRDDSDGDFIDANALDFETLLQIDSGNVASGFRDVVVSPSRGLMFLTSRSPEALVVVDLTRIVDNGIKDENFESAVAVLPLQSLFEDAGADSVAQIGGAGMALTADERFLLVSHFRGNALSVYDLDQGAWGEEIAWIPNLGENPHVVRVSPDGRWAVVANYLGKVEDQVVSSTLAVVDLDPTSETYLEAVTWLVNR